jgi:hypothetical protein
MTDHQAKLRHRISRPSAVAVLRRCASARPGGDPRATRRDWRGSRGRAAIVARPRVCASARLRSRTPARRRHNQERRRRARNRSLYMSSFLDGFVAGPTAGSENALGDGCFR